MRFVGNVACLLAVLTGVPVHAFEVDSYTSGMSVTALETVVARTGFQLKTLMQEGEGATYSAVRVNETGTPIDAGAMFTTCSAKLVSYTHNVDFDADYANLLEAMLRDYGQPKKVYVTRQLISEKNGYIVSTHMSWYQGQDRIEVGFWPEGRTSKGELRHSRGATINYATKNPCWSVKNW